MGHYSSFMSKVTTSISEQSTTVHIIQSQVHNLDQREQLVGVLDRQFYHPIIWMTRIFSNAILYNRVKNNFNYPKYFATTVEVIMPQHRHVAQSARNTDLFVFAIFRQNSQETLKHMKILEKLDGEMLVTFKRKPIQLSGMNDKHLRRIAKILSIFEKNNRVSLFKICFSWAKNWI